MAESARFYYVDTVEYQEKAARKNLKAAALRPMELLLQKLDQLAVFDQKGLEEIFLAVMETTGLKLGKIAQPVRVALTGTTVSPGIFEIIAVLGKDKVVNRLRQAVDYIRLQSNP